MWEHLLGNSEMSSLPRELALRRTTVQGLQREAARVGQRHAIYCFACTLLSTAKNGNVRLV